MVLVDTSVLINYLKGIDDKYSQMIDFFIANKVPFGITNNIYQELLQGAKGFAEYETLKSYFSDFQFYSLKGKESYESAALLNIRCKKAGVTVRSTIDLLIAQTAIENEIMLLANDSDFTNMARVIPELQLFEL